MNQLGFYVDAAKCTGCRTCAVACKDKNDLEVGRNFRRVAEYAGGEWKQDKSGAWTQNVFAYYVSIGCNHCADPACVKVCPAGAMRKSAENGLVYIDGDECVGCKKCAKACPYGAPQFDAQAEKMTKCDGCRDRLAQGRQPVCVDSCPQRALAFGELAELQAKHGTVAGIAPLPDPARTRPSIVINPPRHAQPVGDTQGQVYG